MLSTDNHPDSAYESEHCLEVGSAFKTGFDGISAGLSQADRVSALVSLYQQLHSDDQLIATEIDTQPEMSSRSTRSAKSAVKVESAYDKLQTVVEGLVTAESVGLAFKDFAFAVNKDPSMA